MVGSFMACELPLEGIAFFNAHYDITRIKSVFISHDRSLKQLMCQFGYVCSLPH